VPRVADLFTVQYGHSLSLNALTQTDPATGFAYVSRTARNNGVAAYIERPDGLDPFEPGLLTVCLRSRNFTLATFVQPRPFFCGYHIHVLEPKQQMTVQDKLWWAQCITANRYRYNFGRQANRTLASLELPDEIPDWVAEAKVPEVGGMRESASDALPLCDRRAWKWFALGEVFEISKGSRLTKSAQLPGPTPYIGSSAINNGVTNHVANEPTFPGGVLTVPYNGSVGHAFFQPVPFCAGDDVHVLRDRTGRADRFGLLFVAAVIRHEKYRFTYGRKWHLGRMERSPIKLPAVATGEPDWEYMSRYMKGLPFASAVDC
jgi:hypothetical protein